MEDFIRSNNSGAIRNRPLSPELRNALGAFLPEMGLAFEYFSGGQAARGSGGSRTGSVRHDHGNAADGFFYRGDERLTWENPEHIPILQEVVRRGRAAGLTGFGAGPGYMQPGSMHIGFGAPAVWGDGGSSANAPDWLRQAYEGAETPSGNALAYNMDRPASPPVSNALSFGMGPAPIGGMDPSTYDMGQPVFALPMPGFAGTDDEEADQFAYRNRLDPESFRLDQTNALAPTYRRYA